MPTARPPRSDKFSWDNGAAIPPNLIAVPNTESNSYYLRYCEKHELKPHPARFPAAIPEFFMRMLSDAGEIILDPFAGSCVTGEVAERLRRKWTCIEMRDDYVRGALGRFERPLAPEQEAIFDEAPEGTTYKLHHPGALWNGREKPLAEDGGKKRRLRAPNPA